MDWALEDPSDAAVPRPTLYVCVSCARAGGPETSTADRSCEGKRLYEALQSLLAAEVAAAPVRLCPTICFANCERACTAAIAAPGKWSYMLGELSAEHAADLLVYAAAYAKAATGVVLASGRPASLQTNIIARFPAHLEIKDAAE